MKTSILLLALTLSVTAQQAPIDSLLSSLEEVRTDRKIGAVGFVMVTADSIIHAGSLGHIDAEKTRAADENTLYRIGSVTKSFIALAALQLQERGLLDLNAPIRDIIPEVEIDNPWHATDPITMAHLLEHTAGFDDMHFNETYNTSDQPDMPILEVLKINPKSRKVRWRPGTRMAYANPGTTVAAYVIEKVAGKPFDQVVQEELLDPLGMVSSAFDIRPEHESRIPPTYQGDTAMEGWTPIYLRPSGSLHASPLEFAPFLQMMLNRGQLPDQSRLLSEASITRMEHPATTEAARAGLKTGYGLANYASVAKPFVRRGHSGGIEGFSSVYQYVPELGVAYAVFVNTGSGPGNLEDVVYDYLAAGVETPSAPVVTPDPGHLKQFEGYYINSAPRSQLFSKMNNLITVAKVTAQDSILIKSSIDGGEHFVPTGPATFRREAEFGESLIFTEDHDGNMVVSGNSYFKRVPFGRLLAPMLLFGLSMLVLLVEGLMLPLTALVGFLGKAKRATWNRLWIGLAAGVLVLAMFAMSFLAERTIAQINLTTVTVFACTTLFPILAGLGLFSAIRRLRTSKRFTNWWYLLASIAALVIFAGMLLDGSAFLRTWAY